MVMFEQDTLSESGSGMDLDDGPLSAHLSKPATLKSEHSSSHRLHQTIDSHLAEVAEVCTSQSSQNCDDNGDEPLTKRHRASLKGERLEWSDEDPENEGAVAYKKFRSRKSDARKSALKSSRKIRASERDTGKNDSGRDGRVSRASSKKTKAKDYGDLSSDDEDLMEWTTPEYVQRRRRIFDERAEQLKAGGLQLPPTYDHVPFSDDERLEHLKERPIFDHLKPCAPYKDIQLPYSLGLIPASIAQWLRDYQVKGAAFMHELFVYQKGGILGDDMGLGKTIQVIAFLTAAYGKTGDERDGKRMRKMGNSGRKWYPRTLIICPGSLMLNWKDEFKRWGWWHVDLYHGSADKDAVLAAAQSGRVEIVLTTYTTYKINQNAVNMIAWDCVIADECHIMKDRRSQTAKSMNDINALCRIGLTGTAIQNKYEELWTLLNWTNPGQLGPVSTWKTAICLPLKLGQSHNASVYELAQARKTAKKMVENLLPRFFLRRTKNLIRDQLPKKSDRVVFCPLTETQTEAYDNFLESEIVQAIKYSGEKCECGSDKKRGWCCYALLEDGTKWQNWVFPAITTLQKLSNHIGLLIPQGHDQPDKKAKDLGMLEIVMPGCWRELYAERDHLKHMANPDFCGKWRVLRKLLKFWHDETDANNKVLVFSHSVRLLKMLQSLFVHTSYNVSYLDGSMKYEERYTAVHDFNTDPTQFVFLISTKAGGVGLNITSANKVVVVDPNWNPTYDLQAQDRAYRIGQTRDVEVFRLVSQGTLEEIVYARQIYKQQQASIGFSATSERRYFQGVQDQKGQKGELFGLTNLFTGPNERKGEGGGVLREIVNKTNIAESRADVRVVDMDVEDYENEEEGNDQHEEVKIKTEDEAEDAAMSQLVAEITGAHSRGSKSGSEVVKEKKSSAKRHDPITAILASVGVQYTHENSEVIGSSKVETHLSKRAEEAAETGNWGPRDQDAKVFFDEKHSNIKSKEFAGGNVEGGVHYKYRPPVDVKKRQFCSMAKWAGYDDVVEFALLVESWTQNERRDWLSGFYKTRRQMFHGTPTGAKEEDNVLDITREVKSESEDGDDEL